jgi:hypothetical protein
MMTALLSFLTQSEFLDIPQIEATASEKRQSKDCLFFCQLILTKTAKTPGFPRKNGKPGAFCIFGSIIACFPKTRRRRKDM